MNTNAEVISELFDFLKETICYRITTEIKGLDYEQPELKITPNNSPLFNYINSNELSQSDLIALTLTLVPHVHPTFLGDVLSELLEKDQVCNEFAGIKVKNHHGIIPTGETLLFIVSGNNLVNRIAMGDYFHFNSPLFVQEILRIDGVPEGEPKMSGKLSIESEILEMFTSGRILKPKMGANFPAQLIETTFEWENLILQKKTLNQILEIQSWIQHNDKVMNEWGMKSKVKPGFRILFYGPSGTGKTLTAGLLGKYTNRDVYRIDLSLVVSKYIGETEKNLSKLFDKAANKDWILFFDEADSVFGKRTNVRDAHDKYANQEVSYLLQRIESHAGLVILASNLKNNIDAAFTRRFQSIIEFETPGISERQLLWEDNLPKNLLLEENVSLRNLAKSYSLTGANIVNIIQYACIKTAQNDRTSISLDHLMEGIKKEYAKEGKLM